MPAPLQSLWSTNTRNPEGSCSAPLSDTINFFSKQALIKPSHIRWMLHWISSLTLAFCVEGVTCGVKPHAAFEVYDDTELGVSDAGLVCCFSLKLPTIPVLPCITGDKFNSLQTSRSWDELSRLFRSFLCTVLYCVFHVVNFLGRKGKRIVLNNVFYSKESW